MSIEQWSDLMFPDKEGKDVHVYGSVRAINADGSYEVQLNASSVTTKCTACCTAVVGDRVLVCIKADGRCAAIGRVGGDLGGGGTIVTQYDDVSNYIAGRVFAYAGTDEPFGCLPCDGSAVSRSTYWELLAAIGTTYGAGDGSSTFNLPNIESRTIIGESDSYALGATGGEEKHKLTEDELPNITGGFTDISRQDATQGIWAYGVFSTSKSGSYTGYGTSTQSDYSDSIDMSFGADQPHNNMQPYIVMRYFITTGKGDPASGINPADYVVEWGNTDGWYWEKWASGKAECWATLTRQDSIQSSFGQFNLSYLSLLKTYPFEFVEEPIVTASANSQDYTLFTTLSGGSTTQTPYVNAARPANAAITTKIDIEYSIRAVGRWKDSPASGGTETIAPTIEARFEGIESDIDLLKTNKVLWSGVLGMVASQTATLSEAISEQPNGIMLVFSWYDTATSTAKDWSWHYHPIPKHHVLKHGGQGVNIGLVDLDGYHCAKYLYVSDTGIAGHANNWSSATVGGVDLYKSGHVLRYVIGY